MSEHDQGGKDPRYSDKSPHSSGEQDQPEPERPVSGEQLGDEPAPQNKPSQAEGER